jgi:urea transport system permease protein
MITFQDQIFMQFLTGFSVVAILMIAATGLAIIFGVCGVINMAHGEFIMIGAYCSYIVRQYIVGADFAYTLFLAIPLAFVIVGLLGLIVERAIIQWIYDRPLETLLATWGVGIALQVIAKLVFGSELKEAKVPRILEGGVRVIRFLQFPYYRMFLIVVAIVLLVLTFYVIFKTDLRLRLRPGRGGRRGAGADQDGIPGDGVQLRGRFLHGPRARRRRKFVGGRCRQRHHRRSRDGSLISDQQRHR